MADIFTTHYHPLTARPFLRNKTYREYIPCKLLRPYVFCFWSSKRSDGNVENQTVRMIPDTCVDIIIDINYTRNTLRSKLCGLQDYASMVEQENGKEELVRFAVRFYFWAVKRFLNLDMSSLCNQTLDLELLLPGCNSQFEELFYCNSLDERILWMESYLLRILDPQRYHPDLYNSIEYLLRSKGRVLVREVCEYSIVSQRQLERLFKQEIGISIKRTASLVRYQNVWREVIRQNDTSGLSTADFANQYLFTPLGIAPRTNYYAETAEEHKEFTMSKKPHGNIWFADPKGVGAAGYGLCLSAGEMARIGQMCLEGGMYGGSRVVSSEWLVESTEPHIECDGNFRDMLYGYLWWIIDAKKHIYAAIGNSGNVIYVNPEKAAVVAVAGTFKPTVFDRIDWIQEHIEPLLDASASSPAQ